MNGETEIPVAPVLAVAPVVSTSTLLELPVDYSANINYYYPYFYKTHLITLANDIDLAGLSTVCGSPNCGYCDSMGICMRCFTGFFLYGVSCDLYCPNGYIADNLRMTCVETTGKTYLFIFLSYNN